MKKFCGVALGSLLWLCLGGSANTAIVGDINDDGKIDLAEAMYALQVAAGAFPDLEPSCQLAGKGVWAIATQYHECDVVTYDGDTYACSSDHTSSDFSADSDFWVLLTQEGPQGPAGDNGAAIVYGDGSAGALTINSSTNWVTSPPANFNFQYTDIVVNAQWTIPSGLVLRCSGAFTLNSGGSIIIDYGTGMADGQNYQGLSKEMPNGYSSGGVGLNVIEAASILHPGVSAGGSGDDGYTAADGGAGGGSISVRAKGPLSSAGTITADGGDSPISTGTSSGNGSGGGGGGGGFIILASQTSITNTGSINARGGDGSNGLGIANGGGGGGGGIVHMLAPSISQGTVSVAGGAAGGNITNLTTTSGGSGGALGGNGGRASYNRTDDEGWDSESGNTGHIILTTVSNPENLFF